MTDILLVGACGRMGAAVIGAAKGDYRIAAKVDAASNGDGVYRDIYEVKEECGVIVDFSHHEYTKTVLSYAYEKGLPAVIATTGHTDEELEIIRSFSEKIPVFKSGNMSLGVNALCRLAKEAAALLPDFDVEIIEAHHGTKLDAPSGTALMIANEIKEVRDAETVYDRSKRRQIRPKNEIGVSSIRGGTVTGEHEVIFLGKSERLSIRHSAENRSLFAEGALRAAAYMIGKEPGMYDMKTLLRDCVKEEIKL